MIISDLEDINPNFYPTPINQIPSNEPGIKNTFEKLPKNSYLTKKDLSVPFSHDIINYDCFLNSYAGKSSVL
jgi:hypothetical protein